MTDPNVPTTLPLLDRRRLEALDVGAARGLPRPVRVLQFGTGALLRGLVDDALDRAARKGAWSGGVLAVSQTASGRGSALNDQDGLFTLRVRGVEGGETVDEARVVTAVERVLSSSAEWEAVLGVARDPGLGVVVSNTTEVGLAWDDADDAAAHPPRSFPARLAALLLARLGALGPEAGLVVLPTELVERNGDVLQGLVLRWGARAGWGAHFEAFVRERCLFCTTLVDRIVTGTPDDLGAAERAVGHRDALMTDAEPYRLWAIEAPPGTAPEGTAPEALAARLGFADVAQGDNPQGAVVVESVAPFALRKVRLLNAAHTLLVPVAMGCGLATVGEATADARVGAYLRLLLSESLVPAVALELGASGHDPATAAPFAASVLDRFANPFLNHALASITLQQTAKMAARVVPSAVRLAGAARPRGHSLEPLAFGFAAFLLLHRAAAGARGGPAFPTESLLADDRAAAARAPWVRMPARPVQAIHAVLSDADLWGLDLTAVPGFEAAVLHHADRMLATSVPSALDALLPRPSRPSCPPVS